MNKFIKSFIIFYRSFLVYFAKVDIKIGASRGPIFLGAIQFLCLKFLSLSQLLYLTKACSTFWQERNTIAEEQSLVLSNWASLNKLANPLGLKFLEL